MPIDFLTMIQGQYEGDAWAVAVDKQVMDYWEVYWRDLVRVAAPFGSV